MEMKNRDFKNTNSRPLLHSRFYFIFSKFLAVVILLSAFYFLFSSIMVSAVSLSIYSEAPSTNIAPGSEFPLRVLIDSPQPLNAYSLNFSYPADLLELVNFDNSRSIINIWQSQPVVYRGGSIKIIGASLTPFQGTGGEIMTINFKAIAEGSALFSFGESAVYLANGKGTKVIPQVENLEISLQSGGAKIEKRKEVDSVPPEIKILALTEDPFRPERKILGFLVEDTGSGTKETLIRSRRWLWWSDWQSAINPVALINSVWSIDFRVVDNQGNASKKTLYDWGAFLRYFLPLGVGLFILVLTIALKIVKRRRKSYD